MVKSLIQLAKENLNSYEKRAAEQIIKKLDKQIEHDSFNGCMGTHYNYSAFNENGECMTIIKKHYEDQGFRLEFAKGTLWVWWNEE